MFKGVAFDMDGVLLDSEKIYRRFEMEAAARYGLPLDDFDEFCARIAGGTKHTNAKVFTDFFGTGIDYMEYREVVNEGVEGFGKEYGYEMKPGVKELFDFLKERGIKMALTTSTDRDRAERFLEPHGLLPYFDARVFGNMIPAGRGKPNPDIYLTACRELGLEPSEVIGVEDSRNGVLSSSRGGLYTVMVIDLIQPDDIIREHADEIYENIYEISQLFN
mgnify:CR=1 FL=1